MRARWALASFGVGAVLGAASLPALLVVLRRQHARAAVSAEPTDRSDIGLGQGGMDFGLYEPGAFGVEDYSEHAGRHPESFPRLWCPHCYGSGCRHCHHIGEVAP